MGDERTLTLRIITVLDDAALNNIQSQIGNAVGEAVGSAVSSATASANSSATAASATGVAAGGTSANNSGGNAAVVQAAANLTNAQQVYDKLVVLVDQATQLLKDLQDRSKRLGNLKGDTSDLGKSASDAADDAGDATGARENRNRVLKNIVTQGAKMALDGVFKIAQASLSLVQNIYDRIKQASPLMQSIESLFNLAVQLFFMPLGNKLAEELIPATIGLLDAVIGIWDNFDNMTIGEAVAYALDEGLGIFADYFFNIGNQLSEQTGIVGSIGEFMVEISYFVREGFPKLLNDVISIAGFVLKNFEYFIKLYIAYQGVMLGSQLFSSIPLVGSLLGGAAGGITGYVLADSYIDIPAMAKGGYVPPTDGGSLRILAEAGEGEYVIPESKMDSIGTTIINNNFYGYNEDALIERVNDTVNTAVSRSRISGAF